MILFLVILFIFGTVIGSFLNVVIYRIPREDDWRSQLRSLVSPGSYCPGCDSPVAWYDNIPLISYAVLGGKCRVCGERIHFRYPLVELGNAVLYVLAGWNFGMEPVLFPVLLFISALVAIFFIDLDHHIIPNVIVMPAAVIGLVAMTAIEPDLWYDWLIAGIASAVFFFLVAIIRPGGMGMGDVKLAAMMGFYLGRAVLVALFLGFMLGAVVGVGLMMAGHKGRKSRVPFGPFLAIGSIVALFFGEALLDQYLSLFDQSM